MKTEYLRTALSSSMIIKEAGCGFAEYEMGMLINNRIPGLLEMQMMIGDGQAEYWYDISGLQPMEAELGRSTLSSEILRQLFDGVRQLVSAMEEYFLSADAVCFCSDMIFRSKKTGQILFCYIPGCSEKTAGLKELIEELMPRLDHSDKEMIGFVYSLYEKCMDGSLCPEDLNPENTAEELHIPDESEERSDVRLSTDASGREFLQIDEDWLQEQKSRTERAGKRNASGSGLFYKRGDTGWKTKQESSKRENAAIETEREFFEPAEHRFVPAASDRKRQGEEQKRDSGRAASVEKRKRDPGKAASADEKRKRDSGKAASADEKRKRDSGKAASAEKRKRDSDRTVSGRKHIGRRQTRMEREQAEAMVDFIRQEAYFGFPVTSGNRENSYIRDGFGRSFGGDIKDNAENYSYDYATGNYNEAFGTDNVYGAHAEKRSGGNQTRLLNRRESGTGLILRYRGMEAERDLMVEKVPYVIGSDPTMADGVLQSENVSRLHARITQDEDGFYLEDINSTNGTYLNGKLLAFHTPTLLSNTDRITFGAVEYIVHLRM